MSDLNEKVQRALGELNHPARAERGRDFARLWARDESLGRDVVIKTLVPELAATLPG